MEIAVFDISFFFKDIYISNGIKTRNIANYAYSSEFSFGSITCIKTRNIIENLLEKRINIISIKVLEQRISSSFNRYKLEIQYDEMYQSNSDKLLLQRIKSLDSIHIADNSMLIFNSIVKQDKTYIIVKYCGHSVGGSYSYANEHFSKYTRLLQLATNRKVTSIVYESPNLYTVKIHKAIIINNAYENPKGKLYHIDGGYDCNYAWAKCCGKVWEKMYNLVKSTPDIDIFKYNGKDIFKIHVKPFEEDDSRPNTRRTYFRGSFELLVSEDELFAVPIV